MVLIRPHVVADAVLAGATLGVAAGLGIGWPLAALGLANGALQTWAIVNPRSSWYLPVHWQLPSDHHGWALTFDDGPHPEHTPRILDQLAEYGHHATFFVIGAHVERHPALMRRIRAEGHAVGLHSQRHHRCFNLWPRRQVLNDLQRCAAVIAEATGEPPPRLFRPPVGLKNPLIGDVARQLDLLMVTWSARVWDTRGAASETIARRLERAVQPRAIVLMHDGHEPAHPGDRSATVAALQAVLPRLSCPSLSLVPHGRGVRLGR